MTPVAHEAAAALTQDLLDLALAELEAALESGETSRTDVVLRKYPQYRDDLRAYLNNRAAIVEVMGPLGAAAAMVEELPQIDGYEVLGRIALGGMGIVYRAHYKRLNHIVALKVMRRDRLYTAADIQHFRMEAEVAYRLQHRNIVSVCDIGETDGRPYYAMKLVEGASLKELLQRDAPLEPKAAAEIVREVAEAIAEAHRDNVVHRDLKPGNILVDNTRAPRIIDFGLARLIGEADPLTGFVGTPGYASPEQAHGRSDEAGPAADVYSLGVILYELLTGQLPLAGANAKQTLEKTRDQEPLPPRAHERAVPRDLEAVCMMCLRKDPLDRYASAGELAGDLQRFLAGRKVHASGGFQGLWDMFREGFQEPFTQGAGAMLAYAAVATACIMGMQGLMVSGWAWAEPLAWLLLVISWMPVFTVLRSDENRTYWPTNPAERLLWSIWLGVVLAHAATFIAMRLFVGDFVASFSQTFLVLPVLTGLGFFIMGGSFSTRNCLWGLGWMLLAIFAAALVEPLWLPTVYAVFNILNVVSLAQDQHRLKKRFASSDGSSKRTPATPTM